MNNLVRIAVIISFWFLVSLSTIRPATATTTLDDRWLYGAGGYARALELQRELKVPLVVYFYADWCPYCRTLDSQYLPAAPVQEYLRGVVKVRINPEQGSAEREIAERYGVRGYPAFFILREASSFPRMVSPFRRDGANLTPAQFASTCQQAAVSPQAANINRMPAGPANVPTATTDTRIRKTKGGQIVEVAPVSRQASPKFITDASLPTVDAILTKYIQATGGRDAQRRITSRLTKGKIDVAGVSFGGRLEVYAKAPNKSLTVMDVEPMGLIKQGFDGRTAWNLSDKGMQSLGWSELAVLAPADFYREINLRDMYTRIKLLGKVKEGYRELYMVEAAPRTGAAETLYFDAESGLLIHRDLTRRTSQGLMRCEIYFSDWREVDGVKLPFRMTQSVPNRTFVFTLEDIKHNVPVDEAVFQRPAR